MSSREYFEKVAKKWDQLRQSFFSNTIRDKALSIMEISSDTVAVDMGAGTGFITEGLVNLGVKVIAIDQSQEMLKELESKFSQYEEFTCMEGVSEKLPVADEMADYVFANMYLHHVGKPLAAIKEMVRILKPGGKLIITDLYEHQFEFLRTEHHDLWMGFKPLDIDDMYKKASLKNIKVEPLGEDCCSESCSSEEKAIIGIFMAVGTK